MENNKFSFLAGEYDSSTNLNSNDPEIGRSTTWGEATSEQKETDNQNKQNQKLNELREEKKKEENEDTPAEKRLMVIDGAKLQCPHAQGEGMLKVTSNELNLQDKIWATEGDNNNMVNLQFPGICNHPKWGDKKPPCMSVINLGSWKNLGTTIVQEQKVLVKESCISCNPTPNSAVAKPIPKVKQILAEYLAEHYIKQCLEDRTQCFNYADVVPNPRLNNQSDNVNKNRFKRVKRFNKSHPNGYYHTGVDILADSGTVIHSLLCGVVVEVVDAFSPNEYRVNSLGNIITIKSKDKNENDVWIKYCHLDKVIVKKGDLIKHNDQIGNSGSTGNAASVYKNGKLVSGIEPKYRHIHIEAATSINFKNTRIDPEQFMKTKFDETTEGNPMKNEENDKKPDEQNKITEFNERMKDELNEKIKQPVDNTRVEIKIPPPKNINK